MQNQPPGPPGNPYSPGQPGSPYQQQPGNPYPPGQAGSPYQQAPTGAPAAAPKMGGGMGTKQIVMFAGFGLLSLGFIGFSKFMVAKAEANVVLFTNQLETPGELTLNGKSYGTIAPKKDLRLELDTKSYAVSFANGATKLDSGTLNVAPAKNGMRGYHALYNLGGKRGLGIVTKYYGGSFKDTVVPIEEGTHIVEVPASTSDQLDKVDDTFPQTLSVQKNATFGSVVRVCSLNFEKEIVNCPGY